MKQNQRDNEQPNASSALRLSDTFRQHYSALARTSQGEGVAKPSPEQYGTSPGMQALPLIKAWNALTPEQRCKAASAWMRQRLLIQALIRACGG